MKKVIELPKDATIEVKQDKIIIEYEEDFVPKDGDFCTIEEDARVNRTLFIYNGKTMQNGALSYYAAKIDTDFSLRPMEGLSGTPRPMTEDERVELLEELHAICKDWDAEKMEIVDFKWVPKLGETVYYASVTAGDKAYELTYLGKLYHRRLLERGLIRRTRAEAIACTDKMLDVVKQK